MNASITNSQALTNPVSKFDQLYVILENSKLSILAACIEATIMESSLIFDDELSNCEQIVAALFNISTSHLADICGLLERASDIYAFAEFQLVKRMIDDLNLAIESFKLSTLSRHHQANLIYGLGLYATSLREKIDVLGDVINKNKELLNG